MKNSDDTIENRTRYLPACSAVPQPTAPKRALLKEGLIVAIDWAECGSEPFVQKSLIPTGNLNPAVHFMPRLFMPRYFGR